MFSDAYLFTLSLKVISPVSESENASGIGDDHFAALPPLLFPRRARLSTTVVPRSRQGVLPAGCWPLLFPAKLRAQMRAVPYLRRPSDRRRPRFHDRYYRTLLLPRSRRPSIPLTRLPPNRATNRRLRIGVSCARFDLLRRP